MDLNHVFVEEAHHDRWVESESRPRLPPTFARAAQPRGTLTALAAEEVDVIGGGKESGKILLKLRIVV